MLRITLAFFIFMICPKLFPENAALIINGGYTDDSNYSVHEDDVIAFSRLLGASATILNYNGPQSMVVPVLSTGEMKRDQEGWVQLEPTKIKKSLPANQNNISDFFSKLSKRNPSYLTVVYGDHGDPSGISLGNSLLTRARIQKLYEDVPNSVVRSIHLHCYGESALLDSRRVVPSNPQDFLLFINKNYQRSRCGLATSKADEVGQYYGWQESGGNFGYNNEWETMFKANSKISLDKIKSEMVKDKGFTPSISLTSDALNRDVAQFFCNIKPPPKPEAEAGTCQICDQLNTPSQNSIGSKLLGLVKDLSQIQCSKCFDSKLENLNRVVASLSEAYGQFENFYRSEAIAFIKSTDSKRYERLRAQYDAQELKRVASFEKSNNPDSSSFAALMINDFYSKPKRNANDAIALRRELDYFSVNGRKDFDDYAKGKLLDSSKTSGYIAQILKVINDPQKISVISDLLGFKPDYLVKKQKYSVFEIFDIYSRLFSDLQLARKNSDSAAGSYCRSLVETFLDRPQNKSVKEVYESIRSCEKSNLN